MNPLLEAIIKASAAGAAQKQAPQAQAADPISSLLEGILGGGGASRSAPRQQAAPAAPAMPGGMGIEDLIGSMIGGNASQGQAHHNGIADIIGSIMGGAAGGQSGSNPLVNPIANMLAQKLGIPPALAQAAVAFFMTKMFQRQMAPSAPQGGNSGGGFMPQAEADDSLDLDDLLDSMGDSGSLGLRFSNSGMDKELAEKTGMSQNQANDALKEIVNIFGQQRSKPNPVTTRGADLKGLLDGWD